LIKPGVGDGNRIYLDGARIFLSHCFVGLVFSLRTAIPALDYHGHQFCLLALEEAIDKYGKPEIMNIDQDSQFINLTFSKFLAGNEIRITMDGKGA
jgi:hypothetical protein